MRGEGVCAVVTYTRDRGKGSETLLSHGFTLSGAGWRHSQSQRSITKSESDDEEQSFNVKRTVTTPKRPKRNLIVLLAKTEIS